MENRLDVSTVAGVATLSSHPKVHRSGNVALAYNRRLRSWEVYAVDAATGQMLDRIGWAKSEKEARRIATTANRYGFPRGNNL